MLFSAIENRDKNTFVNVFRSLNHVQVHQLILIFNNCGETLIHQCAICGQYDILKYLIRNFKESSLLLLRY